jgi:hypothetical protein
MFEQNLTADLVEFNNDGECFIAHCSGGATVG